MKQHGDKVAGKKIELIRKDVGGIAPDLAKRLAQEPIVRDHADILAGFVADAERARGRRRSAEAKKFMVVMNAATSIITAKSPYIARTSIDHAAAQSDARHLGGASTASRRPTPWSPATAPASTPSRVPDRLQGGRRQDRRLGPLPGRQSGFLRLRSARQGHQAGCDLHLDSRRRAAGRGRQGAGRARHRHVQDQDSGPGRAHLESALKSMGDVALGIITVANYDYNHQFAAEQGLRRKPITTNSTAIPDILSRSAAMTARI